MREDVEAEKTRLEKREEERITAENVTKEKAQALAKELERQYLLAVTKPGPDVVKSEIKEMKEESDSKLVNGELVERTNRKIDLVHEWSTFDSKFTKACLNKIKSGVSAPPLR